MIRNWGVETAVWQIKCLLGTVLNSELDIKGGGNLRKRLSTTV